MIANIRGTLIHKGQDSVVVDVNGVGYEVFVPASAHALLPRQDEPVSFFIHTHISDDAIRLYGFLTREEKEVFQLLIGVTGVGPKLGRAILSGIPVADLVVAITGSDKGRLSSIPGIGGKTAERLILELKEKLAPFIHAASVTAAGAGARDPLATDVVSALGNLGYRSAEAEEAVRKARRAASDAGFEALFREALKHLAAR